MANKKFRREYFYVTLGKKSSKNNRNPWYRLTFFFWIYVLSCHKNERKKSIDIFYSDGIREGLSKSYELRWRQKKCGKKKDSKEKETVTRKEAIRFLWKPKAVETSWRKLMVWTLRRRKEKYVTWPVRKSQAIWEKALGAREMVSSGLPGTEGSRGGRWWSASGLVSTHRHLLPVRKICARTLNLTCCAS